MKPELQMQDQGKMAYQIEVNGLLDVEWADWFNGVQIEYGEGTTILTAGGIDQSGLRGILCKLWDLNLTVISMNRVISHADK
jgi:hypothetical protein